MSKKVRDVSLGRSLLGLIHARNDSNYGVKFFGCGEKVVDGGENWSDDDMVI